MVCKRQIVRGLPTGKKRFLDLGPPPVALRPKIGQIPLLSLDIIRHNSIIFHPFLTFFILNRLFLRDKSNGVQIKDLSLLVKILVFGPIFAPRPHMGKIVRMDPKPP